MSRRTRIRNIIQDLEEVCSSNSEIHFQYIENYYNNENTNTESMNTRNIGNHSNINGETTDNIADITVNLYDTPQEQNSSVNNTTTNMNLGTNPTIATDTSHTNNTNNVSNISSNTQSQIRNIPINITENTNISSIISDSIESILNDLPSLGGTDLSIGANIFSATNLVPLQNLTRIHTGLSLSELNEKTSVYTGKPIIDDDTCNICNELFSESSIYRKNIKCGHYFHQGCIDTWYAENYKCPICNQNIRE